MTSTRARSYSRSAMVYSAPFVSALLLAFVTPAATWAQDGGKTKKPPFTIISGPNSAIFAGSISKAYSATGNTVPELKTMSTSEGISTFCESSSSQSASILLTVRQFSDRELERCGQAGVGSILEGQIGIYALTLVQRASDPELNLQTRDLYLAAAKTIPTDYEFKENTTKIWSDLNPSYPKIDIKIVLPSQSQGSRTIFDSRAMVDGCREFRTVKLIFSAEARTTRCTLVRSDVLVEEEDTDKRVAALRSGPRGTVALVTYDVFISNKSWMRVIPINGSTPNPSTIYAEDYTLTTSLYVFAKQDQLTNKANRDKAGQIRNWLLEALSESAIGPNGHLEQQGLIALPSARRNAQRKSIPSAP